MFQHRIEDRQPFVHARRERHLVGFPRTLQSLIEGADHRIKASCDDRAHVENCAHLRASVPQRSAITIQGRDADEERKGDRLLFY